MKKLFLGAAILAAGVASAQIQEGNWMVGGQVAHMKFTNGLNVALTPQVGYFIKDNWVVGGEVGLSLTKPTGKNATQTDWSLGAFTRYYLSDAQADHLLKNGRFFAQGNVGFGGNNVSSGGSSTNGVDLGIGAGYSYFITKNVSLDALLKFNALVGAGSSAGKGNLGLNVGFQIYLPSSKVEAALKDR
ncbi:outer membrane protein [Riemerella columbipharyngis]|uniref:Outer membrane protein beta-barrel domain-containing protein n=1 Tax=Riemerella columbipharyngis TaxID=1071918 RepID=A0A1G7B535_9FLAO|nr:outer membrane beta-barrel protein [Riemerella columbipharyngis]SDE21990.1 Outer membrane protein beta-barrel domain-containing protein [Riemerella columbipharyngis]